jgi:hypothetical protein
MIAHKNALDLHSFLNMPEPLEEDATVFEVHEEEPQGWIKAIVAANNDGTVNLFITGMSVERAKQVLESFQG